MADYANFVEYITQLYKAPNSPWISFGGSYSGSLSAWFRLKYPQLIDGAIAASAPVLAQLNFKEYNQVVQNSLGYFTGSVCAQRIANATRIISQMISTSAGRQQAQKIFNGCSPIVTDEDVANFFSNLEGGIAEVVQYNNDNNNYTPMNINKMCSIINAGDDVLQAYANFNNLFNQFSGANCTQVSYNDYIAQMKDATPFPANPNAAGRTWTYQTWACFFILYLFIYLLLVG